MFLDNEVWESESEEPPDEEETKEEEMEEIQQFHHSFFQPLDYLAIMLEEVTFKRSMSQRCAKCTKKIKKQIYVEMPKM